MLGPTGLSTVSARRLRFVCKESFDLLKFSMRKGLPNLTTFYLRKLYAELGCVHERGKKPTSEARLLEALAKHIFGHEFRPDLMKTVVLARTSLAEDALQAAAESPLMVGDMSEALDDDIEDMHLENEIKEYQEKIRAKRLREMQRREALSASIFQSAPAPAAGAQNAARQKQSVD